MTDRATYAPLDAVRLQQGDVVRISGRDLTVKSNAKSRGAETRRVVFDDGTAKVYDLDAEVMVKVKQTGWSIGTAGDVDITDYRFGSVAGLSPRDTRGMLGALLKAHGDVTLAEILAA
jgi:hypothetical protein